MAFELGKFQTAEQRRNAQQVAQADASGMQDSSLRGQQDTAPLSMFGIGGQPLTNKGGRAENPLMPTDPASKRVQQGIFDKAFENYRSGRGTTDSGTEALVSPAERARQSEMTRMAQQYGGNEMRLALMDKAPIDQRLVDYYGAQARGAQALGDQMGEYFANTERFGGDRALADQFVQQHAGVAFREYIKANPQAVVGEGQKAAFSSIEPEAIQDTMDQGGMSREAAIRQIQQGTAALTGVAEGSDRLQGAEAQMDGTIDVDRGMRDRESNQANAFDPLRQASVNQAMKTDEGVGVVGMQPASAAIPAEDMGRLASSPFYAGNKEEINKLGINSSVDPGLLDSLVSQRLRQQLASIKGNKGFSYDA